jgi:hypothetical protein
MWDTTQWQYNAASGSYQPNVVAVATPPAGATTTANTPAATANTSNNSNTPTPTTNSTSNGIFDNFYNASISNNVNGNAKTGNALIMGNTTGGNATSGNALDLANVINMVQSSSGLGGNLATFESNITGDVNGDLTIDPSLLQSPTDPNAVASNLTLNNDNNGQINNNIDLDAGSGNATVADNTTGGNATSGNADAVADVVNMINSVIASKQSFLGVVNIYGNLNGNILVPSDLLNSLLATNGTSSATPTNTATTVDNTNNEAINNKIGTTAQSGQASVSDNTTGGSATSGNATTNVTVFNLTGSQIVASNSLLVFVNVLGTWVGFIMNAPAGTTAAALGGGVTTDTTGSNTTNVDNSTNDQINNNINVGATSGDASVNKNTKGGDATSGNASSSVNLLNLDNSSFSLSNWFGVLFINVFGNWVGSLEASDGTSGSNSTTTDSSNSTSGLSNSIKGIGVFKFSPTTNSSSKYSVTPISSSTNQASGTTNNKDKPQATLVSYTAKPGTIIHANTPASSFHINVLPLVGGIVGVSILCIERFRAVSRRRFNHAASVVMLSKINN